jgi:hypothetical protein
MLSNKHAFMLRLLANKSLHNSFLTLSQSQTNLLRQQASLLLNGERLTSTTSSSKGPVFSISNLTGENLTATTGNENSNGQPKLDLTFEDSKTAFKSKTNLQLLRGYLVFQLCSFNILVDNQKAVIFLSHFFLPINFNIILFCNYVFYTAFRLFAKVTWQETIQLVDENNFLRPFRCW